MSQNEDNQQLHLGEQLNHLTQQDQSNSYKRDSGIEHFQFQQEGFSDHKNHFDDCQNTNHITQDNHFAQQGVFSYQQDHRLRLSMKSQEDFQLEDVSGNADMSDRNIQINNKSKEDVKIVEEYVSKENKQEQKEIVQKTNQQKLKQENIQQQIQSKKQQSKPRSTQQLHSLNNLKQPNLPQNPSNLNSLKLTPKKQTPKITAQSPKQKKQQWSIQSTKSYSPKPQQEIYQSPKKQKQQKEAKQKVQTQKPKISLIKQTFTLFKQPEFTVKNQSSGSGIRDWFRSSMSKPSNTGSQKQQTTTSNQAQEQAKQRYRKQMQAQMLGFQKNLSKHQKANKLFGPSDKQKQKQKINKTHFPQPSNKNLYQDDDNDESNKGQYRMLLKISFQKKKQNYNMLKQWDKNRAQNMNIHKNMIQMLQNQVDKRIKLSLQNFEIYTNFFKQKIKQQEKFINSPVINTKYALQNNSISKNIYINCSVILNSLSQENQLKCKKIQDFVNLIKNNVLKDLADKHLHQSKQHFLLFQGQKQLLKVRQKISTLKSSLKKYNSQTEQKSLALAGLFVQSSNNVSMKATNDFYTAQLQFLRSAGQQILIQKRLGQNCLQYYHAALNQQFKRSKVIKQALMIYSSGLKQAYNVIPDDVEKQQLSKDQQKKLIQQFYSVEDMFDQRTSQLLKERFKISQQEDLSINEVSKFVQSFEFQNFNSRMLTLKQFNAKYFSVGGNTSSNSKDPSKLNRQETCYMVITVDFFIHLFFSSDKSAFNFKPDVSLKIMPKQLQIRQQKQQFIDIVKKEQKRGSMISYFWDSKNQRSYRVKFVSKDAKEQFCDYVRKLMF